MTSREVIFALSSKGLGNKFPKPSFSLYSVPVIRRVLTPGVRVHTPVALSWV